MLSAACSIWITPAYGECIGFGPRVLEWPQAMFVFDGTVLEVNESGIRPAALMQVHRVFKGDLPKRIEVYQWAGMEHPTFQVGKRYVLAITRHNPSGPGAIPHRPFVEPEDDPSLVYATIMCGGGDREALQRSRALDGFGRGWPPEPLTWREAETPRGVRAHAASCSRNRKTATARRSIRSCCLRCSAIVARSSSRRIMRSSWPPPAPRAYR